MKRTFDAALEVLADQPPEGLPRLEAALGADMAEPARADRDVADLVAQDDLEQCDGLVVAGHAHPVVVIVPGQVAKPIDRVPGEIDGIEFNVSDGVDQGGTSVGGMKATPR